MKALNSFFKIVLLTIGLVTVSCGNLNRINLKKVESHHASKGSEVKIEKVSETTSSIGEQVQIEEDSIEFSEEKTLELTDQSITRKSAFCVRLVRNYNTLKDPVKEITSKIPTAKSIAVKGMASVRSQKVTVTKVNAPYFEMMADIIRSFFIMLGILMLVAFVVYCFYEFGGPKLKLAIEVILGILLVIVMFVEAIIWVVDFFKD